MALGETVPVVREQLVNFGRRQARSGWLEQRFGRGVFQHHTLAVVRRYFPGLPLREAKRVAGVALLSIGYLTTISHLRKRVDFLAGRRAGLGEAELVRIALDEIKAPAGGPVPDAGMAPAPAVPRPRMSLADTLPHRETGWLSVPRRADFDLTPAANVASCLP